MAIDARLPITLNFPHRGELIQDEFVAAQEASQDVLAGTFTTNANLMAEQANALEDNVNAKEASTIYSADIASSAANYKGEWVSQGYTLGQSVSSGGTTYMCKLTHATGFVVTNTTYWQPTGYAAIVNGATAKTTPVDADIIGIGDSLSSFSLKKLTWANIKDTLKSFLYITLGHKIQPITATVSANALTVTLSPTSLDFRSTTLGSGAVTTVSNVSTLSLTVPTGATLGATNAVKARLALVAINNAGTMELAIINTAGGNDLSETGIISTTAISGASTANNVFYSATARTNVAYRLVGYIDSTQATAGTYATAPSLVQGQGGNVTVGKPMMQLLTSVSASGTSIDFTGIPSWAKRITVMFDGVSTNGTSNIIIQLGDSGGIENTGYLGSTSQTGVATTNHSSGYLVSPTSALSIWEGSVLLSTINGTTLWCGNHVIGTSNTNGTSYGAGSKALSATLDRIRITTVNGTDTFDAGSINLLVEGY